MSDEPTLEERKQHAKWVLHCIRYTTDFDHLTGDERSAMMTLAEGVIGQADRITKLEAENKRLRKAVWPMGQIGRTR